MPERQPQVGDQVMVHIPGLIQGGRTQWAVHTASKVGWIPTTIFNRDVLEAMNATVEVTLAVDSPVHDLVGTVRGDEHHAWVKIDKYADNDAAGEGIWWDVLTGEEITGNDVEEWPVIGTMPGTPAWRAEQADLGKDHS